MFRRALGFGLLVLVFWVWGSREAVAQQPQVPTGDQLDQLVAPIALYPDTLLAQICAASTDPQQILDADNWLKQNKNLTGQNLINAAQAQKFDPAFVSLVGFPSVLDMMAAHIDDYAALGAAFKANQQTVMDSIQKLRQAAYASGALDTNEYQKVSTQTQGNTQVIVVQPANPQVVYVPQYNPQQVYSQQQQAPPPAQASSGASTGDVVAASLLSFGLGIAIGALIANNNQPYGWGGWGWGWGRGGMYYHNSVFIVNNRYVCPHPYYRPRPVPYNRPIYARPPTNWNSRPYYRPPPSGYRPYGPNNPAYRPGGRPPAPTPYRPAAGYRPPAPVYGNNRAATGNYNATRNPTTGAGATRPATGNVGATRPATGNVGATRPATPATPTTRPATPSTGNVGASRPAPGNADRPSGNQYAGFQQQGNRQTQTQRPQTQQQLSGGKQGAFGGSGSSGASERQASNRGKQSSGGGGSKAGGRQR